MALFEVLACYGGSGDCLLAAEDAPIRLSVGRTGVGPFADLGATARKIAASEAS